MNNVTGYNELYDGNVVLGVFRMFNEATNGWFITFFYVIFLGMLIYKTKSPLLIFVSALLFCGLYYTYVPAASLAMLAVIMMIGFGGALYKFFNK